MYGEDVKLFVKHALSRRHKELSQSQLKEVLCAPGLDKIGRTTTKVKKEQFVTGIQTLCNVHIRVCHEPHIDFMYPHFRLFVPNMGPVI